MSIRGIARRATPIGYATPSNAPVYVDSDDNLLKFIPAGSGTTEVSVSDSAGVQTFTNKTITAPVLSGTVTGTYSLAGTPTVTAPAISAPVFSGTATGTYTLAGTPTITAPTITTATLNGSIWSNELKVLATAITYDANITQAVITGFSWTVVAGATYRFEMNLPVTSTTNSGFAFSFKLTTATLTSIQYQTYAASAVDNTSAVSTNGTTTTDATVMYTNKSVAFTHINIKGTFVVGTGGTFALHGAQETSGTGGDVSVIALGAYARLTRAL